MSSDEIDAETIAVKSLLWHSLEDEAYWLCEADLAPAWCAKHLFSNQIITTWLSWFHVREMWHFIALWNAHEIPAAEI